MMIGYSVADAVKERVTMRQVAEMYGFEPQRNGFIQCPFHAGDNHASLKLYPEQGGWHCFGCGAGGSVIDFVMRLFNLSFRQAVVRLDVDFHLCLTDINSGRAARSAALEERRRKEERRDAIWEELNALTKEYRRCWEIVRDCPPTCAEDGTVLTHPLWPEAATRLPELDWKIELLLNELEGKKGRR